MNDDINVQKEKGVEKHSLIASQYSPQHYLNNKHTNYLPRNHDNNHCSTHHILYNSNTF
jgi:hypothetical protein